MPLRLIGGFDQRWRDTPVKTAAACSCSLALHSSLSLSLPLYLSLLLIPLPLSFALPSLQLFCLFSSMRKHTVYVPQGQSSHLVSTMLQRIRAPGWLLSHPHRTYCSGTTQMAHGAPWHSLTHETGSIIKHTVGTKACRCLPSIYMNKSEIQCLQKKKKTECTNISLLVRLFHLLCTCNSKDTFQVISFNDSLIAVPGLVQCGDSLTPSTSSE